jgi:hypothetical protein
MIDSAPPPPSGERRSRPALRALIDEMLAQVRTAANQGVWTPESRAQAEADLARIMDSVRHKAVDESD